jgi:MFS family permease
MFKNLFGSTRYSHPLYAWGIWLLSSLFMFYKYALEVSPSVMTKHLMSAFQIDGTKLGNLAACYFYSYMIMQIPAGLLLDKFGPRKTTSVAITISAIGSILFAQANSLVVAEIGRFLIGTGASFAALNCLKLIANWFPAKRFAFMAGLMMTLGMLGAVGGQAPLSAFIEMLGWRSAILIISLIGLVLAALFFLVVRDAPPHHANYTFTPKKFNFFTSCKEVFKNPQGWWLSIYSGLAFAPVSVFGGLWGVPFLSQYYNLTQTSAAHNVSLIFIGFAVGAPIFGWYSDLVGKRKSVMVIGTIFALIFCSMVIILPPLPLTVLSVLMFGFGFAISSFLLCFTMIREINAPILAATAVGFMNAFDALFGAVSDPLTGKFLDMGWQGAMEAGARVFPTSVYKLALLTLPAFLLIAVICLVFIKDTFCRPQHQDPLP